MGVSILRIEIPQENSGRERGAYRAVPVGVLRALRALPGESSTLARVKTPTVGESRMPEPRRANGIR